MPAVPFAERPPVVRRDLNSAHTLGDWIPDHHCRQFITVLNLLFIFLGEYCDLLTVSHSDMTNATALLGEIVTVSCDLGYAVHNGPGTPAFPDFSTMCTESGTWSLVEQCERKCKQLMLNASIEATSFQCKIISSTTIPHHCLVLAHNKRYFVYWWKSDFVGVFL